MKPAIKIILIPTLLLFGLFGHLTKVSAQIASGLTAIPPRLGSEDTELVIKPGDSTSRTIKVRNESTQTKSIVVEVKDIVVNDSIGTPTILEDTLDITNRWSASTWIQVSPSQFKIKPGETKALQVVIIAPDDALPGGHYAGIFHTFKEIGLDGSQTSSAINTKVGTLVYITVPGDITENAQVTQFRVPGFSEYGPVDFKTTIANLSDIHITPQGMIAITNWLGGKTSDLPINSINIFPGTSRDFTNTLDRKWLFGRYKAQLITSYGTTGQALVATAFFWVVPVRLLLALLTIIIIITLILIISRQKPKQPSNLKVESDPQLDTLKKKYSDKK